MGKRGPKPMAYEIKTNQGYFRRNPDKKPEIAPPAADLREPEMPDYFNEFEAQKWSELVADLKSLGVLSASCREVLIAYCTAYGNWMQARLAVEKTGIVLIQKDEKGNARAIRNPYTIAMNQFREQMNKLIPELGLSPSSRGRLESLRPPEEDGFQSLLARIGMN